MAEKIGVDIVNLGNTGVTAQHALDRWFTQFQPEIEIENPGLERTEPIMSMGVTTLAVTTNVTKIEGNQHDEMWAGQDDNFSFIAWSVNETFHYPQPETIQMLLNSKPKVDQAQIAIFTDQRETNLTDSFRTIGCETLLTGPNDFRNLSVEIIPEGDNIGVPYLRQHASIRLDITGENPFTTKKSVGYAIFDKKSQIPILIGKYTSKTR